MDIKRRVMKAYEGETEQVGMTAQMKGEARAAVMKVARLSGLRDACVLQAANGQYLPFQESSISPVSGAGRSLIEQWFECGGNGEVWVMSGRKDEAGRAYVAGINEGYMRQHFDRVYAAGGPRAPRVVKRKLRSAAERLAEVKWDDNKVDRDVMEEGE